MIKLLQPSMPTADDLLPYLRRIDAARVYVNHGPLVQELQARLEAMTGAHVAVVSNGTVALELALRTHAKAHDEFVPRSSCRVTIPALTFSATGLAALNAGFSVALSDVDEHEWEMTDSLSRKAREDFEFRAAVMPVATFGMPIDARQWETYTLPVIIDAAGAFPQQEVSKDQNIITCFSMHATKFIGCGEGGFVASVNKALIERIRSMAAFGENGTNAKMSEYHAAVALASLDKLPEKFERLARLNVWYAKHGEGLSLRSSTSIMNVLLPVPAHDIKLMLFDDGIETKQWYRPYLDERLEFMDGRDTINGRFPVTDHLRGHLLGLPFHAFLTESDVAHICTTLKNRLRNG